MAALPQQYPGDLAANGYRDPNQQDLFYPSVSQPLQYDFEQLTHPALSQMAHPQSNMPSAAPHLSTYPVQPPNAIAGPSYIPYPQLMLPPSMPNSYQYGATQWPQGREEDADHREHDVVYGALEVKHRRRTTPEQLKVLEYWFEINPKPDTQIREMLAAQLSMTKRNVQVWFQNRRAKVKGIALREKRAATAAAKEASKDQTVSQEASTLKASPPASGQSSVARDSPPSDDVSRASPTDSQVTIPPVTGVPMVRRASLANGEAAKIESFIVKHRMQARKALINAAQPGFVSPLRSPRRTSNPYPPVEGQTSLRSSPGIRPMSSALHLTALRNQTRKEVAAGGVGNANPTVPGGQVQLISSGPFTPPRVVPPGQSATGHGQRRALSPIRDHVEPQTGNVETQTDPSLVYPEVPPYQDLQMESASGPLPSPSFSFGSVPPSLSTPMTVEQAAIFMDLQNRGRLGSIASVNTFGTADGSDWSELTGVFSDMDGFDPDARRASAPADLLHELGILGIDPNNPYGAFIRPSPLGSFLANNIPFDIHPNSHVDISSGSTPTTSGPAQDDHPTSSQDGVSTAPIANYADSTSVPHFPHPVVSFPPLVPSGHSDNLTPQCSKDDYTFFGIVETEQVNNTHNM